MTSLTEFQAGLTIGTVESVDGKGIEVSLVPDAPHGTALNARIMARFPRVNSYVVIPSEAGPIVALVSRVNVGREGRRLQPETEDLVDTATPDRKISLVPLGVLTRSPEGGFEIRRGVLTFPTVGDPVLLPTTEQLAALTRVDDRFGVISIGRSPLAGGAQVRIRIDKLFARHLAILGNTGSGKSCSVVAIVRSAVEAAREASKDRAPDLRIVLLDVNDEYGAAFEGLGVPVRRFSVAPEQEGSQSSQLRIPGWLWSSSEWTAFGLARPGAQAPYIRQALIHLRGRNVLLDPALRRVSVIIGSLSTQVRRRIAQAPATDFGPRQDAGQLIVGIRSAATELAATVNEPLADELVNLKTACEQIEDEFLAGGYWNAIDMERWTQLGALMEVIHALCIKDSPPIRVVHEDDPIPFPVEELPEIIEISALGEGTGSAHQWVSPLLFRLRALLSDRRISAVAGEQDGDETLEHWLESILGRSQISVIDLSLVPTPALQVFIAVLARLIFEGHERFRRAFGRPLPTILVAEEAHQYLQRRRPSIEEAALTPSELCASAFERIAREGRKFGLGLVVTSQRPSELSETVLSQANTFLVHRIVNESDQALIKRMVPDALGDLLEEMPSLPTRMGILLGWATDVPTIVEINELDKQHQPRSQDPPMFAVWAGGQPGWESWAPIAASWAGSDEANAGDEGIVPE